VPFAGPDGRRGDVIRFAVALCSAAAATVHFAVLPEHAKEYWAFGAFFLASGAAQLAWAAVLVRRPSRVVLWLGAAGNLAIVAIWIASRTRGLPFGPEAGEAEAVTLTDLLATASELVVVAGCTILLLRPLVHRGSTLVFCALGLFTLGFTTVALAAM
jgi:hypothetical protein